MTRQDWADVALVVALGAAMLGSCALLRAVLPHGAPEQPPAMAVSDKGAA